MKVCREQEMERQQKNELLATQVDLDEESEWNDAMPIPNPEEVSFEVLARLEELFGSSSFHRWDAIEMLGGEYEYLQSHLRFLCNQGLLDYRSGEYSIARFGNAGDYHSDDPDDWYYRDDDDEEVNATDQDDPADNLIVALIEEGEEEFLLGHFDTEDLKDRHPACAYLNGRVEKALEHMAERGQVTFNSDVGCYRRAV